MPTKQQLEEQLINLTKQIEDETFSHYLKLKNLHEERQIIKVKLEGKHYEQ